jgi:hypothetical protein
MADSSQQLKQAIELIKSGDRAKAVTIISTVLKTDKSNVNAWYLLANALTDKDKQIKALENALKIQPSNTRASTMLAKLRAQAAPPAPEPQETLAFSSSASDDAFDDEDEYDDGDYDDGDYYDDDQYDDEDDYYDDEDDPFDEDDDDLSQVDSRLVEAIELIELGDKRGAIKLAQAVMKEDRRNVDAYWVYANAEDNTDRKVKALERVIALKPDHDEAQTWLDEIREADDPDSVFADIDDDGLDPFAGVYDSPGSSSDFAFETTSENPQVRTKASTESSSGIPLLFELISLIIMVAVAVGGYYGLRSINGEGTVLASDGMASTAFDMSGSSSGTMYMGTCSTDFGRELSDFGSIPLGAEVSGNLTEQQAHSWTFEASAGDVLTVVTTGAFDGYIELIAPNGTGLLSLDDEVSFDMPILRDYQIGSSGAYRVSLCGFSSTESGDYSITVTLN